MTSAALREHADLLHKSIHSGTVDFDAIDRVIAALRAAAEPSPVVDKAEPVKMVDPIQT